MDVSGGSSINYAEVNGKNESESSLMDGFKGFPFKILYIAMELCSGINLKEFINHHFD
jgi:serine/threonine protein kinase